MGECKVIPAGRCFPYVHRQALVALVENGTVVCVHGRIKQPFTDRYYPHAWIEVDGLVMDWQTMEMGSSKFAGKGWPIDLFYETFNPISVEKYSSNELIKLVRTSGHTGPFR